MHLIDIDNDVFFMRFIPIQLSLVSIILFF